MTLHKKSSCAGINNVRCLNFHWEGNVLWTPRVLGRGSFRPREFWGNEWGAWGAPIRLISSVAPQLPTQNSNFPGTKWPPTYYYQGKPQQQKIAGLQNISVMGRIRDTFHTKMPIEKVYITLVNQFEHFAIFRHHFSKSTTLIRIINSDSQNIWALFSDMVKAGEENCFGFFLI